LLAPKILNHGRERKKKRGKNWNLDN